MKAKLELTGGMVGKNNLTTHFFQEIKIKELITDKSSKMEKYMVWRINQMILIKRWKLLFSEQSYQTDYQADSIFPYTFYIRNESFKVQGQVHW